MCAFITTLLPCTGARHPPKKEIEQRRQENCMVKQGASSGAQAEEKGPWNVERGAGHLGRVQERGESMQGRTSSLWGWRSTGTGCPGWLWSLLLWRYSRPTWTRSSTPCCRWPCFGRGVGLDDSQRSLPTLCEHSVILCRARKRRGNQLIAAILRKGRWSSQNLQRGRQ